MSSPTSSAGSASPATPGAPSAQPWYRERWPWFLMAGPAIVVVAGLTTAWLAVRSNDGLVDDDYYKQGLAVNQRVARDQRAQELSLAADVFLQPANGGEAPEVRAYLRGRPGFVFPDTLTLRVTHPTRSGIDQSVALRSLGNGLYGGRLTAPISGRWHVALENASQDWRLVGEWRLDTHNSVSLPPPPEEARQPITYHGK
ncbi:hypothetical protein GH865_07630 [Rhodocyclus tenuis]|uniref:FixH family protein n=1 Tax=Rhodocyclus gracilis TaxID=2929842 RepID=UPI001298DC6D|nr:FixH family protein [Rhodocyclus gracilis]MRD73117.1 hypothetical protein [Rhodocyclus gracilis]